MEEIIRKIFRESIETKEKTIERCTEEIKKASETIIESLKDNKKILICGNGGSAADAQHFAAELIVRFEKKRKGLPSIALTTDTSSLTAAGNDYGFNEIFKRQVNALGNKGDVLIGISTSGNSKNIINAIEEAEEKNMKIISLLGKEGGEIAKSQKRINIVVPSYETARIQEAHITIIHTICKLIDNEFCNLLR